MVDVPTYYLLGDVLIGAQANAAGYMLVANDRELYGYGGTGVVPNAYIWDAALPSGGVGATVRPYDPALYGNPCGADTNARNTFGPDVGFMRPAGAREGAAGAFLFKLSRRGVIGPNVADSKSWQKGIAGGNYEEMVALWNAFHAFIDPGPLFDRIPRAVFVNIGWNDAFISQANADGFYQNLVQWISDLRNDICAGTSVAPGDLPVIAQYVRGDRFAANGLQPDEDVYNRMQKVDDAFRRLRWADPNFRVANTHALRLSLDENYIAPSDQLMAGQLMWEAYLDAVDGPGTPVAGVGVPVYFLFGQSHVVGNTLVDWLADNGDAKLTHLDPQNPTRAFIWNFDTNTWQQYNPFQNANTGPHHAELANVFGPEISLLLELQERHPEGVFLYKFAVGGSSISVGPAGIAWKKSLNQLYPEMRAGWNLARAALINTLGVVPDVRGLFWMQGEGDALEPYASNYESELRLLIQHFRDDLSTRSSSSPLLPVVIGKPTDTGFFQTAPLAKVRAAQEAVAASDGQVSIINFDDRELYPIRPDNVHFSGMGTVRIGRALDKGLDQVDNQCAINVGGSNLTESSTTSSSSTSVPLGGANATLTTDETIEQIIAKLDQAILDGADVVSYTINGRTVTRRGMAEMTEARDYYMRELAKRRSGGRTRTRATL